MTGPGRPETAVGAGLSGHHDVRFERLLQDRAKDFDLVALHRALRRAGYGRDEIVFESNADRSSPGSLVESVRFERRGVRIAVVELNIGLLGADSVLPSYFAMLADSLPDPEPFHDFIRFFDHKLIEDYVDAADPEGASGRYGDWDRIRRAFLGMLGVGSVSTLQWIMQSYFPELRVSVRRQSVQTKSGAHGTRLGTALLDGTGILGRNYGAAGGGFGVQLVADDETNDMGIGWPFVVKERLETRLRPLLRGHPVALVVSLVVLAHASWARLDRRGYLGWERIRGSADSDHEIVVFRGVLGPPEREG